jgi:hypothetical protein
MWLYQKRLLALDEKFDDASRTLSRMIKNKWYGTSGSDDSGVRLRLGMVNSLIRVTKEEAAFLARLGQLYDLSHFVSTLINLLERQDPVLCSDLLDKLHAKGFSEVVESIRTKAEAEKERIRKENENLRAEVQKALIEVEKEYDMFRLQMLDHGVDVNKMRLGE